MRSKVLILIILTCATPLRAFAQLEPWRFLDEECQLLLERAVPTFDAEADLKAAELQDWITFRHPVLRGAVARAKTIDTKFELLFLATGYMLPPSSKLMIGHYSRGGRFSFGTNKMGRFCARDLAKAIAKDTGYKPETRRQMMVSLLTQSLFVLHTLVEDRDVPPLERRDYYKIDNLPFSGPRLHIGAWKAFSNADVVRMKEMTSWMSDLRVRSSLVKRIVGRGQSMLIDQDKLYAALKSCGTPDHFDMLIQQVSSVELPSAGEAPTVPAKIATEVRDFVASRALVPRTSLDESSLSEIHRDLHRASSLLNASLRQIQALRAGELDPVAWQKLLDGSSDSIENFEAAIIDGESYAFEVLQRIKTAERVSEDLSNWLSTTNALVAGLNQGEADLAGLANHEKVVLQAIVTMLPAQTELMSRALISLGLHRDRLVDRLAIIADLKNLLGGAIERRLSDDAAGGDIVDTPEYQGIVATLDRLAKGGSRVD